MTKRKFRALPAGGRRLLAGLVLPGLFGLLAASPAVAQPDPAAEDRTAPADDEFVPQAGAEDAAAFSAETPDFEAIDELLARDEEVLSDPGTYSYDPGARRDPFRSLLARRVNEEEEKLRPEGPPGLLIDEIEIQGVFILPEGPVAQVMSASQDVSFLLRPGDQLWDGDVVRITLDEIVFKQTVNDPTALKPFREVVRKLEP